MDKELELKFEFSASSLQPLQTYFDSLQAHHKQILLLNNSYYDTKGNDLRNAQSSVRVRTSITDDKSEQYELTVKSSGNSMAGLHQRNEVNVILPSATLDLSLLPKDTLSAEVDVSQLAPIFTTNFNRQLWLIRFQQSEIEIAIDCGEINTGTSTAPIQEIELELKKGLQIDLMYFALTLSQFELHLFSQSKASRGYRLVNQSLIHKQPLTLTSKPDTYYFLGEILQYWQHNEEVALVNNDILFYGRVVMNVNRQLNCFFAHHQALLLTPYYRAFKGWSFTLQDLTDVTQFAYSKQNTSLKLQLLLLLMDNNVA